MKKDWFTGSRRGHGKTQGQILEERRQRLDASKQMFGNKNRNMFSTALTNKKISHIWLRVNHQILPELKKQPGPQEEFTKLLTKVPWNLVPTPRTSVVNVD